MSEKLCPAGCGGKYDQHYKTSEHCPWWIALNHSPADAGIKWVEEHWRDYWTPKVGDWVYTLDSNAVFKITSINADYLEDKHFQRHKQFCRPATPDEIRQMRELEINAKNVEMDKKDAELLEREKKFKENVCRQVGNLKRIRELTGVGLDVAAHLVKSFKMEVGAKYLAHDGRICVVDCNSGSTWGVKHENLSWVNLADACGVSLHEDRHGMDLLCRVYERGEKYFVTTGEIRPFRDGEHVLGKEGGVWHYVGDGKHHAPCLILQEIHIQAAGPASATPEARHDPASRPAAIGVSEPAPMGPIGQTGVAGPTGVEKLCAHGHKSCFICHAEGRCKEHHVLSCAKCARLITYESESGVKFKPTGERRPAEVGEIVCVLGYAKIMTKELSSKPRLILTPLDDANWDKAFEVAVRGRQMGRAHFQRIIDEYVKKFPEKVAAAAKEPVTQQDASSGRAVTPVAPAAQPLPTWLDGDVEAYLARVEKFVPSEMRNAKLTLGNARKEGDSTTRRELAAYIRAEILREMNLETDDPEACLNRRLDGLGENLHKNERIRANRYQKTFDLEGWTRGGLYGKK